MGVETIKIGVTVKIRKWAKPILYACAYLGLDVPDFCFSITINDSKVA